MFSYDNGLTLKHEETWKSDLGEDRPVVVAAVAVVGGPGAAMSYLFIPLFSKYRDSVCQ